MVDSILDLVHGHGVANALHMGRHEMEELVAMDATLLQQHELKLALYFGARDGWVSDTHVRDLEAALPRARMLRCRDGLMHAFVLGDNNVMAHSAWTLMLQDLFDVQARS